MTNKYSYMHFVAYKNLGRWDIKNYISQGLSSQYKMVVLGDYIHEESTKYDISDKTKEYGILGVNNQTGIFDAYRENGSKIHQKYKRMKDGWIAYNPYRVNVGSIGIKLKTHQYEYISPAYVVFSCKKELLPEYLFLLMKSQTFNRIIRDNTTGSVRQNLSYARLRSIQIPLPSLKEQKALVEAYQVKLQEASILDDSLSTIVSEIDDIVLEKLAVTHHSAKTFDDKSSCFSFLKFISSSNISRWDVFNEKQELKSWKYENTTLSHVLLEKPAYGAGYKSAKKANDIRYIRITDINEDGTLNDEFVSANEFEEKYLLKPNDFLIARSGNTVGKTFLYESKWGKAIFAGYLIRFVLDTEKINPYYLLAYTKSSIFKKWIANNMRVSGQPNINSQQYMDASLILPPLSVQQEIVDEVQKRRAQIASCREQAAKLRQDAIVQFEQAIFE